MGTEGRYFEMTRAVWPVSVREMISLPRTDSCRMIVIQDLESSKVRSPVQHGPLTSTEMHPASTTIFTAEEHTDST